MPQQKSPEQKSSFSIINYASVYPQPITSESVLEIETGINASVNIKVYNIATGQQSVYSSLFLRANERTYLPVESEKFSSGTYILLITATAEKNKTSTKTIKIISL